MIKYFNEPGNREPLITLTLGNYRASENCKQKKAGEQLIKFFISDQRTRKLNRTYKDESEPLKSKIYKEVRMLDSIQNAEVLAFYREHKKYLNKNEVGEVVAGLQPIILSHYDNIEMRQTFFKDLLERAVKEGRMEKTNYVHFLLRTESFTNPDFFKNIEQRMAEVRKEYDLPNYMWTPF